MGYDISADYVDSTTTYEPRSTTIIDPDFIGGHSEYPNVIATDFSLARSNQNFVTLGSNINNKHLTYSCKYIFIYVQLKNVHSRFYSLIHHSQWQSMHLPLVKYDVFEFSTCTK